MDVVHSCRCCLRRAPDKDLMTPYTHLGTIEIYSEMLRECFEIHLTLDSDEEVGICDVCVGRLRDASDFKLQVQHSQAELQARLQGALQVKVIKVESIMEDGDGTSEEPVLCEDAPMKSEMENEDGMCVEERQEMLDEERAVKAEVSDDASSDEDICIPHDDPLELEEREELITVEIKPEPKGKGKAKPKAKKEPVKKAKSTKEKPIKLEAEELTEAAVSGEKKKEETPAIESIMEGEGTSEEPVLCEEAPINSEMENEDEISDEERQEMLGKEPAVKAEVSDDAWSDEDCKTLLWAGCADSGAEPARPVSARAREQLAMGCSVRLERLRGDEAPHASQTCLATSRHGPRLASRMKDMPDDTAGLRAEEQAYTCDTCGEHFTDKSRLIHHVQAHITQADKLCVTYSCKTCSKEFSCINIYRKHVEFHTNIVKHNIKKRYLCEICNKSLNKRFLKQHMRIHIGEKPFSCGECNKKFTRKDYLSAHKIIHTGVKPYRCKECNKQFQGKGNLKIHVRIHTGVKPYSCKECNKQFRHKSTLDKHRLIHTGEKPYGCNECNKQFRRKADLTKHMSTHTGVKPYSCNECNKQFPDRGNLTIHEKIHTGVKPYGCNECNKQFRSKSHLIKHARIHAGVKPYSCNQCYKTFRDNWNLDTHKRIHTGVKPYSCNQCNKQFRNKSNLNKHERIHTRVKPYRCNEYNTQFTRKDSLDRHKRMHTGIE